MIATTRKEEKAITIGSCTEYLVPYEGAVPEINSRADLDALCTKENQLAETKGGATVTYTKETEDISSDLGTLRRTITKSDSAKFKFGLFGWNSETLKRTESTARVEDKDGVRITKIGGLGNDDGKLYMLIAYHKDAECGDCWWILVGKNTAGFELAYSMDDGTKLEPEFTANSMDDEGTLVIYIEEIGRKEASDSGESGETGSDDVNAG